MGVRTAINEERAGRAATLATRRLYANRLRQSRPRAGQPLSNDEEDEVEEEPRIVPFPFSGGRLRDTERGIWSDEPAGSTAATGGVDASSDIEDVADEALTTDDEQQQQRRPSSPSQRLDRMERRLWQRSILRGSNSPSRRQLQDVTQPQRQVSPDDPDGLEEQRGGSGDENETVTVTLNRGPRSKIGISVHVVLGEDLIFVQSIHAGGLVDLWNEQHPEAKVGRGDWIISANGVSDTGGNIFAQLQREGELEIVFSRQRPQRNMEGSPSSGSALDLAGPPTTVIPSLPSSPAHSQRGERFAITVQRTPDSVLGIQVTVGRHGIVVTSIGDGLIHEQWNALHPQQQVQVGDRIVFVNGVRREEIVSELGKDGTLFIVLQRHQSYRRGFGGRRGGARFLTRGEVKSTVAETLIDRLPRKVCGHGEKVLDRSPSFEKSECCGICLEDWEVGNEAVELPCKHLFHMDCIRPWLANHSALCPLCGWAADHNKALPLDPSTDVGSAEEDNLPLGETRSVHASTISTASGPYLLFTGRDSGGLVEVDHDGSSPLSGCLPSHACF